MVMTENLDGGIPEVTIDLPSKVRIRQRLGMVSTSRAFKREIVPEVMKMGGKHLPADKLTESLAGKLSGFPDGQEGLSQTGIELGQRIINGIIDNDRQQSVAVAAWTDLVQPSESNSV